MVSPNKVLVFLAGFFLFSCFFYSYFGFQFGDNNNREELPLIYEKITNETRYPNDDFVIQHTSSYTQITPFLTLFSIFFSGSELSSIKGSFVMLHLITLFFLFLFLHLFLNKLYQFSSIQSAIFIFLIALVINKFIPAGRWLFIDFFDPEWLTITIIFGFFYMHLTKQYITACFLISIAGILYPIYIIPIFPAILYLIYIDEFKSSKKKAIQLVASYAGVSAFYSVFLWLISRQSPDQPIDASYIMEYIRAPWHYKIPSIHFMNKKAVGYLVFILPFLYFGRKLKSGTGLDGSLYHLVVGIFITLLATSIIHSIVRIPLIVQISPYRIGLFSTTFAFLLIPAVLSGYFNLKFKIFKQRIHHYIQLPIAIISLGVLVIILIAELRENEISPEVMEAKNWIRDNTTSDDLFLNYSGLALRTHCLRASYFEFKTIPLTADGQMEWYRRLMLSNKTNEILHPVHVNETLEEGTPIQQFNIYRKDKFDALPFIDEPINYLVTDVNDTATIKHRNPIFMNSQFAIFKTSPL